MTQKFDVRKSRKMTAEEPAAIRSALKSNDIPVHPDRIRQAPRYTQTLTEDSRAKRNAQRGPYKAGT